MTLDTRQAGTDTRLDFDEILAAGRASAAIADIEVPRDLAEALNILIDSVNADGQLSLAGAAGKRAGMARAIANRLRLERALQRNPEITEQQINGPVVIIGLPRSGTTKLHRMIAADPAMQKLPLYKLLNPVPLSGPAEGEDPRIALAQAFAAALRQNQPELYAAHPMATLEPDEDVFVLEVTGYNYINCSTVPAPAYKSWLDRQPFNGVYTQLKTILQTVQFFDGGAPQPWVLKAPQHMGFLPEVFENFPQATIVHCHRDPVTTVASYIGMITAARRASCMVTDPVAVGEYALAFWGEHTRRYLRDRNRLAGSHRFVDLSYRDIVANGAACATRIFKAANLPLSRASLDAMQSWERENGQHKHGKHTYDLAEAGLTAADIHAVFAEYTSRYGAHF